MKTRINKLIALALAGTMALAAVACGGGSEAPAAAPAAQTEEKTEAAAPAAAGEKTGRIGYNQLVTGDFALDSLGNHTKDAIEAGGYEAVQAIANGSLDQTITDIENLIQSGVDGLVLWLPIDTLYITAAEKCEAAGVPFVLADKLPVDESILEELKGYKTFVGGIAPNNRAHGENAAQVALSNGWTKGLIIAPGVGDGTATPRIEQFKETFEAAGGEILGMVQTDDSNEAVAKMEDLYLANPDAQFIFATGASTFGTAALQCLQKYNDHETKIITCELDSTIIDSMTNDDYVISDTGDYWICGYLAPVILMNYLNGTPFDMDGGIPVVSEVPSFSIAPEYVNFYQNHLLTDGIYSADEIKDMIGISFADFEAKFMAYSLPERAIQKFNEGKVTEEELAEMGVEKP